MTSPLANGVAGAGIGALSTIGKWDSKKQGDVGKAPVGEGAGGTNKQPATVDELMNMINKRDGVTARYATGEDLAYLKAMNAEGSHVYMQDGTSHILIRQDVATRHTVLHEYMHSFLQRKNGTYMPGEDQYIEEFLERLKEILRL